MARPFVGGPPTSQDRADLAVLRAAVSDAVGHLRDTIGVLRDGSEGQESLVSSVEPVEELVARTRESGVAVHLRREGAARALPRWSTAARTAWSRSH